MKDTIDIASSSFVINSFYIAGVTIKNGNVTLEEGLTLDQASLDFWEAIDRLGKFDESERKAIVDGNKPICNLVWEQARVGVDDVVDYYRVAEKGDRSVDGSAPFPVWGSPHFFAKLDIAEKALQKIFDWTDFPETGKFWDDDPTRPISYGVSFGSNGQRDYMRAVARDALEAIKANTKS